MPIDTTLLSDTGPVDKADLRSGLILPAAEDIETLQDGVAALEADVTQLQTDVAGLGSAAELDASTIGEALITAASAAAAREAIGVGTGGGGGSLAVESLQIGDHAFLTELDGDVYLSFNAYHDGTNWMRVDVTAPAYKFQFNIANNMVFESYKACTFWIASAAANPIGAIATVGGWELAESMSQFRDKTFGGGGIELDGHGTVEQLGYGRLQHATAGGLSKTGILCNVFLDEAGGGRDRPLKPSWQAGFQSDGTTDRFVINRAPGGDWAGWTELLRLSNTGSLTLAQALPVASGGTGATTAAAARTALGVATVGLSVVADNAGAVLTAGPMGDIEVPFACTITSVKGMADQAGGATVDFLRAASGVYPPVTSLCAGAPLVLSGASSATANITTWTKTLAAGDILRPVTSGISTITRLTVNISLTRT